MKTTCGSSLLLALLFFGGPAVGAADDNPARPNILWVTTEDNSPRWLRLYDEAGAAMPNLEGLAQQGLVFNHAFANAPVCSVARSTLITGCYAPRIGTQYHRKSETVPMPQGLKMFPHYLKEAGYYITNNRKQDYNAESGDMWHASSRKATWRGRKPGQPFFHVRSLHQTHEGSTHFPAGRLAEQPTMTDPDGVELFPYHPDTPTFRYTYAHYYDQHRRTDEELGAILSELKADGLMDDTIIFIYGDHGGVMPRSKGYAYESGLQVPLVICVPEKWRHLSPAGPGSRIDGFVQFVDFAPTVLHLAGLEIPKAMDGKPFLGEGITLGALNRRDEAFGYADRFDEKFDFVRTLRKGRYKYMRSYQPFNIDGLYNEYRYKMLAYREWRDLYHAGKLNEVQRRFFEPRAPEALYDLAADPHETVNLASDPAHADTLKALRDRLRHIVRGLPDLSFYPESVLAGQAFSDPVAFGRKHREEIHALADIADLSLASFPSARGGIEEALASPDPWSRYWGLIVCSSYGTEADVFVPRAKEIADSDAEHLVRVRAAEFLALVGARDPVPVIEAAVSKAGSRQEALLMLNTAALLKEVRPEYRFDLSADRLPQAWAGGGRRSEVAKRINYLSGTGGPMDDFIAEAEKTHGDPGGRAARFLVRHMPDADRKALGAAFLGENLDFALRARETFSWAARVPEPMYLNDVLPYAVLNETRERWRQEFFEKARDIVRDAGNATEAVQLLNRDFFNAIDVHYHTERRRTNQSPSESIEQGRATCTGLSIILVYACRAVGIPARVVGTPLWTNRRGNHTWVEFWDGDWHFLGADEYNVAGVDRGWFAGDAAKALEDDPIHALYATSWKETGLTFPMIWSRRDGSVSAVNVTARYAAPGPASPELGVRRFSPEGKRVAVKGVLTSEAGKPVTTFMTRSEAADLNDVPRLPVEPGKSYRLRFGDRETEAFTAREGTDTRNIHDRDLSPVPDLETMPRGDLVARATRLAYEQVLETSRKERLEELEARSITLGDRELKWLEATYGEKPEGGRSLWISMHGGGGAPASVNDQQWRNQAGLYQPEEGVYVAPRGPTDAWNLWHQGHIDPMFQRLIENFVAFRGVNPNKVYLMGYSAGGDGVWQLGPRMADRFAAAAMMAGHPNEASLLGLRNLPFAVFVGGEDKAYDRNTIVAERIEQLKKLHRDDPDGYIHLARVYEGMGHWMEKKDAEALPWMAGFSRNPWPAKLVWYQDDVTHDRFYWLKLPPGAARQGQQIAAVVEGQQIGLEGDVPSGIRLRLSDKLVDLDQDVTVRVNGKQVFSGKAARRFDNLTETLAERLDPAAAACAELTLSW